MGADDEDSHADMAGCLGMWRLTGVVLDPELGSITVYECELCGAELMITPGETHPVTA
jgi:hypothetical protein